MSDMTEPPAARPADDHPGAEAQISAPQPKPLGIVGTFGWAILASIAGVLPGATFILAACREPVGAAELERCPALRVDLHDDCRARILRGHRVGMPTARVARKRLPRSRPTT